MHSVVRHERILTLLRQHGLVSVRRLAREVRASDMTVRRDLAHLCDEGLVRKLHGGAVLAAGKGEETHFSATRQEHGELAGGGPLAPMPELSYDRPPHQRGAP